MMMTWRLPALQSLLGHLLLVMIVLFGVLKPKPAPLSIPEFLPVQLMPLTQPLEQPKPDAKSKPRLKSPPKPKPIESKQPKPPAPKIEKTQPVAVEPKIVESAEPEPVVEPAQNQSELIDPALNDLDQLLAEEHSELEVWDELYQDAVDQQIADQQADIVAQYTARIREHLKQHWSRPPTARNGMEVILRVHLLPGGRVRMTEVVQSSGDLALDHSAKRAIQKARSLPVPEDPVIFNRYFRRLILPFRPEDLRR